MSVTATTVTGAPARRRESPARRRVLEAALALFYAEGIHTVGIDRVIAEAGVAKATFYHHFPSKEDLVCAYLAEQDSRIRQASLPRDVAPEAQIMTLFEVLGEISCGPGFRGCAFINAAAEYPDPAHPVRRVIAAHRRWFRGLLHELLVAAGHPDAERTSAMLVLLRDGLVIGGDLDDLADPRPLLREAVARILAEPA
jgi:AcrR family transcriptional regulator